MQTGAVALIDALGFRGIWNRHNSQQVLDALKDMKDVIEAKITNQFATQPSFQCSIAFLSDTIAISMALDDPRDDYDRVGSSVLYLADVVSWILEHSLRSKVPLAYRGAIAIGEYELSAHFLIGQAIDEAAAAHERSQGAMIWLTPGAKDRVSNILRNNPRNTHLVRFPVPLKGGDTFPTFTVSPLEQARGQDDANALTQTLLHTFSSPQVEVAIKRQNTIRHVRACYEWRGLEIPQDLLPLDP
ncbi:hypothetical protein H8A97_40205 [Bradyrhizobium sp. Arg62]|uniref:hypothetical protein n=1 Tax=Bradyrhizobium brasilense TaxID=1419277 RepID=UPI001E32FFC8|nr:hypothetical protein [Bradyrhizobium brasilense]MCC8951114.1 hypothetical protein [Bradyrhizobium brasilense]